MAVISDAMVKVNLAFAEHTSDDWLHAVRRLNAGCTAWGGLILLSRCGVSIGSATSNLVQRGAFIMRIEPSFLFDLDGTLVDSVYQHVLA